MTSFREALGRRVLARDTAEEIGHVTRFLIGGDARIASVTVRAFESGGVSGGTPLPAALGGGLAVPDLVANQRIILDWPSIVGFGPDAVVTMSAANLRAVASDDEQRAVLGDRELLDRPLMTDAGTIIGTISDVQFDDQTGALGAFVVGDRVVPLTRIVAVGPFAVIIEDAPSPSP